MGSIAGSSVTFKASSPTLLNSSFTSKNYWVKSSVSFRNTNANAPTRMPSLRVSCTAELKQQAKPETVAKVITIVRSQLAIKDDVDVTGETKFSDLGADSLDTVEIVMALEEEFQITVNEDSAQTINNIHDAANLIEKLNNA